MKGKLFLYHCSQNENNDYGTYSDFVVAAESEEEARNTHPDSKWPDSPYGRTWCKSPDAVKVVYLGEADPEIEPGIICASFHAG